MTPQPITVVVVDDQQIVREGLVALLGLIDDVKVLGAAADGAEALDLVESSRPDVVLMDLRMPVLDGIAATRRITTEHAEVAVLVLTTYSDDASIADALDAGARGYLTKDAGRVDIAAALRSAVAGQSTFDPVVSGRLLAALQTSRQNDENTQPGSQPAGSGARTRPNPDGLTAREQEVLVLIAGGLNNAEIATRLFIGETTVKTHINNVFAKINARNRADAVRYAYQTNLATP